MGSLSTELRSKIMSHDAELYLAGCRAYETHDLLKASKRLADAVRENDVLLWTLARYYIEHFVAPDMTGERLSSARGGQRRSSAQGQDIGAALRGPVEGGGGQAINAIAAIERLPPPSSPLEGKEGQNCGTRGVDKPLPPLPSPIHSRAGQSRVASGPAGHARSAVKPNPPRGLSAIAAVNRSLFDTFRVRDGRCIGDLTVFEARQIASTNEREARILRAVCDHVGGYVEPGTPLRNAVKPEVLERAIAKNMEISDVA